MCSGKCAGLAVMTDREVRSVCINGRPISELVAPHGTYFAGLPLA